jgi:PAS domain S-box-containing protein
MVASRTSNGVVITDAAGVIAWVNDGFTRMTGYRLDEVTGKRPGSVLQ